MRLSSNRRLSRFSAMVSIALVIVICCRLCLRSCQELATHRDGAQDGAKRHVNNAVRNFLFGSYSSDWRRYSRFSSRPATLLADFFLALRCSANSDPVGATLSSRACAIHKKTMIAQTTAPTVVLTREKGKNEKLRNILEPYGIRCIELPIVETVDGPQKRDLVDALNAGGWSYVVVTSPEAAAILLRAWEEAGEPAIQIVALGSGTADALSPLRSVFEPSQAGAKYLAAELPWPRGSDTCRVLWPTSVKAKNTLRDGLSERGFNVTRLDTYSTEPVKFVPEHETKEASLADVVTFASGSQLNAWKELIGIERLKSGDMGAAFIGRGSSAKVIDALSLPKVRYPESAGVDGWAESVLELLGIESRQD